MREQMAVTFNYASLLKDSGFAYAWFPCQYSCMDSLVKVLDMQSYFIRSNYSVLSSRGMKSFQIDSGCYLSRILYVTKLLFFRREKA